LRARTQRPPPCVVPLWQLVAMAAAAACILGVGLAGPGGGPAGLPGPAGPRAHACATQGAPAQAGGQRPLDRHAPLSLVRGLSLRLRGAGGARDAEGDGGKDARSAETRGGASEGFTRSPSPQAPPYADATGRTGSRSLSPSGPVTRSSSPHGLLIAMCAWESLHTVAVGGVAPHVTELAAGLARRGNEVHLFVRAGHDMSQARYEVLDDVHVHRVPIELSADFVEECNNMCNAFVFHIREAEAHMHTVFDLVHVHDWLCAKADLLKSVLKSRGRSCARAVTFAHLRAHVVEALLLFALDQAVAVGASYGAVPASLGRR